MARAVRFNPKAFAGCASWVDAAEDDDAAATAPEAPRDALSALPDDLLVRLLATASSEAIAALACVAKRYANVCERAGWACAARRFGRRTTAPFGGGAHWTALAWVPARR